MLSQRNKSNILLSDLTMFYSYLSDIITFKTFKMYCLLFFSFLYYFGLHLDNNLIAVYDYLLKI